MPFGLCNAPTTFQRLMESCLGEMNFESLLIYLDDVIVFAHDFATHLEYLSSVPALCSVSGPCGVGERRHPMEEKVKAVSAWPQPTTVKELRAFLGLKVYYHRFIQNFAEVAAPLHALLVGCPQKQTRRASPPLTKWTPECEAAFQSLKEALIKAPVLAFADFSLPFIFYTDASKCGLGAVLNQVQDGGERVIAYASRSLHPTEKNDANYSSFKLEFLALKWAVTEKFNEYLLGSRFTVFTDNNPLTHLQTVNLGSVEQRWTARLASYNFDVKFRAGKVNANADALSRKPLETHESVRASSVRPLSPGDC